MTTTTPVDVSEEEVERLCLNFSGNNYPNGKYCHDCGQSASLDENVIAVLRALRNALTAAQVSFSTLDDEYQRALILNRNAAAEIERQRLALTASEKDAARYRWLLEHASPNQWRYLGLITPDAVNETIDATMEKGYG